MDNADQIRKDWKKNPGSLFALFLNQSPGLAWILDEKGDLIFANKSFFQFFELTDAALHSNISEIINRGNADIFYGNHLQVLETGIRIEMSEMLKQADGTTSLFHISCFPIMTESESDEKLVGGLAISLINEYSSEVKLKEVNEQLSILKKTTTNAIWEWDLRTGHIHRNDILLTMIGYKPEKEQGLTWWLRRIHPEDRELVSEKIKMTIDRGQKSWEMDYRLKCADDNYKHINDHGFVIYENGFPVKLVGSLKEVTEIPNFL